MKKSNIKLAKEWFGMAEGDYISAKVVLREKGYYGTSCFLAQQIVEKYLKGYLVASGKEILKIHDLIKLLNECREVDKDFLELEKEVIYLNDYYIETRYPMDFPIDYKKNDAKKAVESAERVINFVLNKLGI